MTFACLLVFVVLCPLGLVYSNEEKLRSHSSCPPFECGKFGKIKFPFTKVARPAHCGMLVVEGCDKQAHDFRKIQLQRGGRWYQVESISQNWSSIEEPHNAITIRDEEFQKNLSKHDCNTFNNLTFPTFPFLSLELVPNITLFKCPNFKTNNFCGFPDSCNFSICHTHGPGNSPPGLPPWSSDIPDCCDFGICHTHGSGNSPPGLPPQCSVIQLPGHSDGTSKEILGFLTDKISIQLHISDECNLCYGDGGECQINKKGKFYCHKGNYKSRSILALAASGAGIGFMMIIMIMVYYFRRKIPSNTFYWNKEMEDYKSMEDFLRKYGPIATKRYSYSEIKKMTESFKDKLGQGGFGAVFKGKLPDGHLVAVKILKESKSNGEEFINEVASIGRTSHVNVVILLGFCFERSRRALIYEFMCNGSLDKYIYVKSPCQLGWQTLYQVAVGIARGLEYLHGGCNTRILHFDIKPHNILLDENFCPKISDFGLAKICQKRESIVSMLGARGTVGYIAPEVFCRNYGGVSHKSDVYSYGMLVLEMVGAGKNSRIADDHTSEVYFLDWIYKHLEPGEELGVHEISNEEENQVARKMILVSLWCIQTNPSNRPSMSLVVEMLQGNLDSLSIPPKPCLSLPSIPLLRSEVSSMATTANVSI